jgi:hypothetical protein
MIMAWAVSVLSKPASLDMAFPPGINGVQSRANNK